MARRRSSKTRGAGKIAAQRRLGKTVRRARRTNRRAKAAVLLAVVARRAKVRGRRRAATDVKAEAQQKAMKPLRKRRAR